MVTIGIDTHKATLAVSAIDGTGRETGARTFPNDRQGHVGLLRWAQAHGSELRFGIEGSGVAVARLLVAAGEAVVEVPAILTERERRHLRRAGKSDPGDALAIARVALREADLGPIPPGRAGRRLHARGPEPRRGLPPRGGRPSPRRSGRRATCDDRGRGCHHGRQAPGRDRRSPSVPRLFRPPPARRADTASTEAATDSSIGPSTRSRSSRRGPTRAPRHTWRDAPPRESPGSKPCAA
jgi:hypothetical protein